MEYVQILTLENYLIDSKVLDLTRPLDKWLAQIQNS